MSDRLKASITRFTASRDQQIEERNVATEVEKQRQAEILQKIESLNDSDVNTFLEQPIIQPHIDSLGLEKSTREEIRGLRIKQVIVPGSELHTMKQSYSIAYLRPFSQTIPITTNPAPEKNKITIAFQNPVNETPEPKFTTREINGIVVVKEVGTTPDTQQKQSKILVPLIEIILPEQFGNRRIFDTVLDKNVTPELLESWSNERFESFATIIDQLSNK